VTHLAPLLRRSSSRDVIHQLREARLSVLARSAPNRLSSSTNLLLRAPLVVASRRGEFEA